MKPSTSDVTVMPSSGEHKAQALVDLDRPLRLAVATVGGLDKLGTPRRYKRELSRNKIPVRRN
jgi:hypothetical protein